MTTFEKKNHISGKNAEKNDSLGVAEMLKMIPWSEALTEEDLRREEERTVENLRNIYAFTANISDKRKSDISYL